MTNLSADQEEGFLRGSSSSFKPRSFHRLAAQPSTPSPSLETRQSKSNYTHHHQQQQQQQAAAADAKEEFSTAIAWPIVLAIIPTLGAFIAGSAEVWSDFIMILLILYYVYKWITVPWSYYESARSRRMIHQYAAHNPRHQHQQQQEEEEEGPDRKRKEYASLRKASVKEELRRHELIGLTWVVMSPAIAGYTLQYSRYFLSNYDKYMSTFNVTVFVLAATLKPLFHVMALLRERTLFLQSEIQVDESEMKLLQRKMEMMEVELDGLRKAFVTKRDLGQATQGINPTIQQLTKAVKRFEKKETSLRSWSEGRFTEIDQKVQQHFDQFICYSIEQDQRNSAQQVLVTLMFLPMNLTFWVARRMTGLLPIPRALLNLTGTSRSPATIRAVPSSYNRHSRHLTHTSETTSSPTSATTRQQFRENTNTTINDPSEMNYSGE